MGNCPGKANAALVPRAVVILDNGSVYFSAVGRVLDAFGWPTTCLSIGAEPAERLVARVQALEPDLIIIGAWEQVAGDEAFLRELRARPGSGSVLIVRDGDDPGEGAGLAARVAHHEPIIPCTTAALDRFLCAPGANSPSSARVSGAPARLGNAPDSLPARIARPDLPHRQRVGGE